MKRYGAFEAKTHFSEILSDVVNGDKVIITKHGVQVAMIVPFNKEIEGVDPVTDAIRTLKNLKKGITLGKNLTVRELLEEGRK